MSLILGPRPVPHDPVPPAGAVPGGLAFLKRHLVDRGEPSEPTTTPPRGPDVNRLSCGSMATDDPMPAVYDALRKLAEQRLASERPGHTLQATALVHDVYLKLAGESPARWNDTAHFLNVAAEAMRRILVDYAKARGRAKRGGGRRVPLTEMMDVATLADGVDPADVLALDAAVTRLETVSPPAGAVVRLRFYAGLSVEQTAEALNVTPRTVIRKWTYARAWLRERLSMID